MTFSVMKVIPLVLCGIIASGCGVGFEYSYITYINGNVFVNGDRIEAPFELIAPTTLQSAKNSFAVLQIGNAAQFAILSNTALRYEVDQSEKAIDLSLEKGSVVAAIRTSAARMLLRYSDVSLFTKDGTFEINCDNDAILICAFEGNAELVKGNAHHRLNAGDACEIVGSDVFVRKVTPREKRMGVLMQKIAMIDVARLGTIAPSSIVPAVVVIEMMSSVPHNLREALTMSRLARKEGPLSVITTKDGKQVVGHVRARGNKLEIATGDGMVVVSQINVVSVVPYATAR
ncbi:MAG: hypothetical protein N2316_06120 [Spirochaetes bacterium]|nr:hypothetical protein [Spirochaetota bacterium]